MAADGILLMGSEFQIQTRDALSGVNALFMVRSVDGAVGICLSLEKNGDTEIFFNEDEIGRIIRGLQEAISKP